MTANYIADSRGGTLVGPYGLDPLFLAVMVVTATVGVLVAVWGTPQTAGTLTL